MCDQIVPSCDNFADWKQQFAKKETTFQGCVEAGVLKCEKECSPMGNPACVPCVEKYCPEASDFQKCAKCLGLSATHKLPTESEWKKCASCGGGGGLMPVSPVSPFMPVSPLYPFMPLTPGILPVSDTDSMKMWWIGGGIVVFIGVIIAIMVYKQK